MPPEQVEDAHEADQRSDIRTRLHTLLLPHGICRVKALLKPMTPSGVIMALHVMPLNVIMAATGALCTADSAWVDEPPFF